MGKLAEMMKRMNNPTQGEIDSGARNWNPELLGAGLAPRVGTGTRPANMPAWAADSLPAIQAAYSPEAAQEATNVAAALRAAPVAQASDANSYANTGRMGNNTTPNRGGKPIHMSGDAWG